MTARLASVAELESPTYRAFMAGMNEFARQNGLREFTNWSKVWEYPWLWHNALQDFDWKGQRVLDLGSEISPMPWFLASLGARVTLIETDPQWIPHWERLRATINVEVDWHIVDSEILPVATAEADIVTSFSVIEHQPNKTLAVDEVARVLKPGGTFAVSFDIAEPTQGMTFPAWNGRALTLAEFEKYVWRHPAFETAGEPDWNVDAIPDFHRWHLLGAPHHNYVVGAAVLSRRLNYAVAPRVKTPPRRVLFVRPDTYGDLFLFEPIPRLLREAWPDTEVGILIRERYADIVPLVHSPGLRWLTTSCDPYRKAPADDPEAFARLQETVQAFAPDCLAAACTEQTWMEAAVAAVLPDAAQWTIASGPVSAAIRAVLEPILPADWDSLYSHQVTVDPNTSEWEKNLQVASALLGWEAPRWWPVANVPQAARERTDRILAEAGLKPSEFVACAAAGTTNVAIKAWPAEKFGEVLAWLERERGIRALLVGHLSEKEQLEAAQSVARARGGNPTVWTGLDSEMPLLGALLASSRFYFGNDTGALHLAAALGRPVVSLFGGGHWPRFRPVAARELTIVQPLPCFGCAWDCDFGDAPCVHTISVATVVGAMSRFLESAAPDQWVLEANDLEPAARAIMETAVPRLRFLREDGLARLRQTEELARRLDEVENDRAQRLRACEHLSTLLAVSEADRTKRLAQVEQLTALLHTSEADRAERLRHMERLTALLRAAQGQADVPGEVVREPSNLTATGQT